MPVLETTDEITPRSVLRHRPIGDKKATPGTESVISAGTSPIAQRASRVRSRNTDYPDDVSEWQRGEAIEAGTDRKTTKTHQVKTVSQKLPKAPRSSRVQKKILARSASLALPGCWNDCDVSFVDIAHISNELVEYYLGRFTLWSSSYISDGRLCWT